MDIDNFPSYKAGVYTYLPSHALANMLNVQNASGLTTKFYQVFLDDLSEVAAETLSIGVNSRCSNKTTGAFLYCSCVGPMARLRMKLLHATWLFPSKGLRKGPITKQQVAHH